MGFMALFSGFMYKGSYNVEVRLAPWLLAVCRTRFRAPRPASNRACVRCDASLARFRVPATARRASACCRGHRGLGAWAAPWCVCSRRRAAQVTVADSEPAESALRRFRKSVLNSGVLPEVRRHAAACPRLQRRTGTARRA